MLSWISRIREQGLYNFSKHKSLQKKLFTFIHFVAISATSRVLFFRKIFLHNLSFNVEAVVGGINSKNSWRKKYFTEVETLLLCLHSLCISSQGSRQKIYTVPVSLVYELVRQKRALDGTFFAEIHKFLLVSNSIADFVIEFFALRQFCLINLIILRREKAAKSSCLDKKLCFCSHSVRWFRKNPEE